VQLALHHWLNNMKALQGRNKLRTYCQGTIWGRIGKQFTANAFEVRGLKPFFAEIRISRSIDDTDSS
jgi:hypothetical protein